MQYKAKIQKKYYVGDEIFGGIHTDYEIIREDGYKMSFTEGRDINEEAALHLFKIESLQTSLQWGGWNKFWKMIDLPEEDWFMPICEDDYMEDPENPEKHDIRTLGYNAPKEMEIQHVLVPFIKKHLNPEVWMDYYVELDKVMFSVPSLKEEEKVLKPLEEDERKGCPLLNKMDLFEFLKVKGVGGD